MMEEGASMMEEGAPMMEAPAEGETMAEYEGGDSSEKPLGSI